MKVTIDLENLGNIVEGALEESMKETVLEAVKTVVREKVDACLKEETENSVNDAIRSYVEDYIKDTKVQVGNSWDDEGVKEYTVEEYLKQKVKYAFEKQVFTREAKDRWGDRTTRREEISFKDYVDSQMNVDAEIKKYMDKLAKEIKNDVNIKVKSVFDESMKTTLAENVFNILASSDTYRTITRNIQLLGE